MFPEHQLSTLATGLGFVEGPTADGASHLLVASMTRGRVYRVSLTTGTSECLVEVGAAPNGLAWDLQGSLLVAQSGDRVMTSRSRILPPPSIQRVGPPWDRPVVETVVRGGVHAPSDCVMGPDGRLWFTDPGDHDLEVASGNGHVRAWDPRTGEVRTLAEGLSFPNGLALGLDPREVYVAETALAQVRRYRLSDSGTLTPDGWVARLPHGRPDGLAVDRAGWVWVAGSVGCNVLAFDPEGDLRADWRLGDGRFVTSLCFAGEALDSLVVTSPKGGTVLTGPAVHPGLPLPADRQDLADVVPPAR